MSKTYWLVSSNGVPKTTKKNNQLFLGDVNAGSVKELKRSEKYNYIYYLKNTDESILDKNITSKLSFKTKLEAIKIVPYGLKKVLLFLPIYFTIYTIFIVKQDKDAPIYLAFAAAISTMLISFVKIFKKDLEFGPLATLVLGVSGSYIATEIYLKMLNIISMPSWLGKNNIGNILTMLCSITTFLGYFNDSFSFYQRELHISAIDKNSSNKAT